MESVPPQALVDQGHEVTLFASGDSMTSAKLVSCSTQALRLHYPGQDPTPYYMIMLEKVRRLERNFDIIHFHIDQYQFPIFRDIARKTVTTLHGRQDIPGLRSLYTEFSEMPLVAISDAQRGPLPEMDQVVTIPHGLPHNLLQPILTPRGGYLAFVGRISPEKRVDRAIRIATSAGLPIKIAAKVDKVDQEYFKSEIEPMLQHPLVEFVGEIDERRKHSFLGEARALLFPIDWPEPFGLVMIEAMACGTPVLAFRNGSVAEVIDEGVTGYIVDNEREAVCRLGALLALDRLHVRRRFEERFTAHRMAKDYVKVYSLLLARGGLRRASASPSSSSRQVALGS